MKWYTTKLAYGQSTRSGQINYVVEIETVDDHQSLYYLEKKREGRTNHGKFIA